MKFGPMMTAALALAIGGGVAALQPATAQRQAASKGKETDGFKLSKPVREAVAAAQTAITAGDYATAKARLASVAGAATTDDDRYVIASLNYQVGQATKDQALLQSAGPALLASNRLQPKDQAAIHYSQAQAALDAKNYQAAEAALQQVIRLRPEVVDVYPALVDTQVKLSKPQEALATLNEAVKRVRASGQPVDPNWLRRGVEIAYRAKLPAETTRLGQELVSTYPTPDHWFRALAFYRDGNPGMDQDTRIDLMRLMRATDSLRVERLYLDYVAPLYLGYPAEADAVVKEGIAKGVLNASSPVVKQVATAAGSKVEAARKELPSASADARKAANGKIALQTADTYLGFKDYAKAVELYRVALEKGGMDPNLVNTRLGIALALSGQGEAAKQAFAAVTGPRTELAQYWSIYAGRPTGAAAAAQPASTGTPG